MALELPAYARMRQIIGSAAEWSANDLVIGDGEVAILRRAAGLLTIRIGDGATPFSGLRDLTTITATFVDSDGVTDNSAAITAANARGLPLMLAPLQVVGTRTFITVPIVDTGAQIFAAGALITVDNKLPVRPEWFSSNARVDLAVFCLPSPGGGVVQLADRVYPSPGDTALLGRSNYTIRGVRRPNFNAAYTGLENGSIVQGPFTFRGDNVTLEHFGVDSGSVVVGALYGGTAKDGFLSGLPVATRNKNLRMFDLVALCKDATSLVHAFCLEGYTNSEIDQLKSAFGVHGVSLKNTDTNVSNILARGHGFDGVIVKSDTATTTAGSMNLTNIVCGSINAYDGGGLRVTNTAGGQSLTGVTIRNLQCDRTLYGIDFECNDTHLLDSVEVDGAFVFVPQTYGFRNSGQARRCKVRGLVLFNPGAQGVISSKAVGTGSGDGVPEIDFTDVLVANGVGDGFTLYGRNVLSRCVAMSCGGWGLWRDAGSRVRLVACQFDATNAGGALGPAGTAEYAGLTLRAKIAATLNTPWTNFGSGKPIATYSIGDGGEVRLAGLVATGGAGQSILTVPPNYRPTAEVRLLTYAHVGANDVPCYVTVQADGQVVPSTLAGTAAFLSLDGLRWQASHSDP